MLTVYRQGDVLLVPIDQVPAGAVPQRSRLIRRGEHGGLHVLEAQPTVAPADRATIVVHNGTKYVLTATGVGIVHGEHHRVALPAGAYRVVVQRESTSAGVRAVMD